MNKVLDPFDLEIVHLQHRVTVSRIANRSRRLCQAITFVAIIGTLCSIPTATQSLAAGCYTIAGVACLALCQRQIKRIDKWEKREMRV